MSFPFRLLKDIDFIERAILVAFYGVLLFRLLLSMLAEFHLANLLYLFDQGLVLAFLLLRRPAREITRRPRDWAVAFGATVLPMFVVPAGGDALVPSAVYGALMLAGMALHLSAKLSLRRSFGVVAANRGVQSAGAYRFIRHPMYAGYMVGHVGFLLAGPSLTNALMIATVWVLHVTRILTEERVLSADPSYRDLMARTRFRLIPGLF